MSCSFSEKMLRIVSNKGTNRKKWATFWTLIAYGINMQIWISQLPNKSDNHWIHGIGIHFTILMNYALILAFFSEVMLSTVSTLSTCVSIIYWPSLTQTSTIGCLILQEVKKVTHLQGFPIPFILMGLISPNNSWISKKVEKSYQLGVDKHLPWFMLVYERSSNFLLRLKRSIRPPKLRFGRSITSQ